MIFLFSKSYVWIMRIESSNLFSMSTLIDTTFSMDKIEPSLKVCGITTIGDAMQLVEFGVTAMGFNFWPKSKRYIEPTKAAEFSQQLKGRILRVGVFVNASHAEILHLLENNIIDVAQLHGDENISFCQQLSKSNYPFIKAIGVKNSDSLKNLLDYQASAILLDAHAPGAYGGTGDTFDWGLAREVIHQHPEIPVILAGGITAENAAEAIREVNPHALDVASGAEISPGIKDFNKISAIQKAMRTGSAKTSS